MIVAFDTETELIRADCLAPRLVCTTFDDGRILRWDESRAAVEDALRHHVVGHNVAYDLGVFCAQWPDLLPTVFRAYREGRVHDTKIRQQLVDIANGEFRFRVVNGETVRVNYGLADLSLRLLGEYVSKGEDTWRMRYGELRDVPIAEWPAEAVHYAVKDAQLTRRVFDAQGGEVVDEAAQCRAAWWLHLAACWGMCVDPARATELETATREEVARIEESLLEYGLLRREGGKCVRNTDAAKARMVEAFGGIVTRSQEASGKRVQKIKVKYAYTVPENVPRTESGDVSLAEEACEESGDEVLQAYAQYSALGNVLSKDFSRQVDKKTGLVKSSLASSRIHPSFNSLVANGRTSCRGFNLQNMRAGGKTRLCFSPPPGCLYLVTDLAAAEFRAWAQCCLWLFGESRAAQVLNEGKDPHCMLAAELAGRDYDDVVRLVEAEDAEMKIKRKVGKHGNFALMGLVGPDTFIKMVKTLSGIEIDEEFYWRIFNSWTTTWPEAGPYLEMHKHLGRGGAPIKLEQFVSGRVRGGMNAKQACNTRFSGLIADAAKAIGFAMSEEMYVDESSPLFGSRLVNFPHDEFVAEVPEELGHECAVRFEELVKQVGSEYLPDVPLATTPILSRTWSKDAKQVKRDGRIVPWEPKKEERAA